MKPIKFWNVKWQEYVSRMPSLEQLFVTMRTFISICKLTRAKIISLSNSQATSSKHIVLKTTHTITWLFTSSNVLLLFTLGPCILVFLVNQSTC